ncbi:triose-phosphate isomerase [Echinimonas agarilytica]|uniref:Triosephosphate isomerase n=1 Tax=Echinimonas agarilytica TaxID=1215918 RepID=A0AA41W3Y7_9GAMM|nr:triose-phosphate isomerase [Echinimonas agarilytica]MCM2678396.1 triose-phosphate isomerase [Echinimonas agarilytica]
MRRKIVMGNWKLNGTKESVEALLTGILPAAQATTTADVAVCAPDIFIDQVSRKLADTPIAWGAENNDVHTSGAYTGETSPTMLKEFGCTYVLVGHSERRQYHGESDASCAHKYALLQEHGLIPVLCIGETLEERESDRTNDVIRKQLAPVLNDLGVETLKNAVIAYEPVWAIGTGKAATKEMAQEVHAFIRQLIAEKSAEVAQGVQVLYGGSVKGANAVELFAQEDIDGALVGGAALIVEEFDAIIKAAG